MYTLKKRGGFPHKYEFIVDKEPDNELDLATEPELANEPEPEL